MSSVTYYGDGKGNWTKRTWAEQCDHKLTFGPQCQGVLGHTGNHWAYSPDGSYVYDVPGKLEEWEVAGGSTPPGHKEWVNPIDKRGDYHVEHFTTETVTDVDLINRLNNEEDVDGAVCVPL